MRFDFETEMVRKTAAAAKELIFPRRCPICDGIVAPEEGLIHRACERKLVRVQEPVCMRCGKPVYSPVQEYCLDCSRGGSLIDGGAAVWVYTKEMSESISMYKYQGRWEYADFYVRRSLECRGAWIAGKKPDCITAVPLNKRKERIRERNQALLIAQGLSRALGIPVDQDLLVRSRYTKPQKSLDPAARMRNLQKAFGFGTSTGRYQSVLLVDDIYTTGSTMKICTQVLKEHGIATVWTFCLCIGSDY